VALIPDQLRWAAEHVPDEVGFAVVGVGELTQWQWHRDSSRLARGLISLGVQPGDRVALALLPADALTFVVSYAATHKAGGVAVPINTRMSPAEIRGVLGHCEPTVIVASTSLRHLVDGIVEGARVLLTDADGDAGVVWSSVFDDDDSDVQVERDEDDLAEILYTSGTTSAPKGVAIRHSNSAMILTSTPQWTGRCWLHASPLFTFAGLTFVYQPMRMGMSTLYLPKFSTGEWLRLINEAKPLACFLVPSMVELLLADPETPKADWSCLSSLSVGSAPIAPATLLKMASLVPDAFVTNSYSMTEAGTAYFMLPQGGVSSRPGAVGKPIPPAEVRILDDDGKPVGAEEVGHIQVKPAGRMREYYKAPEASREVFGADGWLRTGDLGKFDEDGYLYVVGRAKDVIIRGGLNVYAADVEAALFEHPAVQEAAVVGVPHEVLGEEVVGFVVLKPGTTAGADELTATCKERVANYAVPSRFHFVPELPRNATGKVLKRNLREPTRM
jgi:acyl-CoA synthetase (AMP-forming)/AMP-acid ligase II